MPSYITERAIELEILAEIESVMTDDEAREINWERLQAVLASDEELRS